MARFMPIFVIQNEFIKESTIKWISNVALDEKVVHSIFFDQNVPSNQI